MHTLYIYKIIATVGKWQKSNEFVKTDQLEHCNDASSKQSNLGEKFLMKKEKGDDADDDDDFPSHCVGSIYNEPRNANPPTL